MNELLERTRTQIADGTYYHQDTLPEVVKILERHRKQGGTLRVHYGDPETGRDRMDESDVRGRIARSAGPLKVPLLIESGRSGGDAMSDNLIVKIATDKTVLWQHPAYHTPELEVRKCVDVKGYEAEVLLENAIHARFKRWVDAYRWMVDMLGP